MINVEILNKKYPGALAWSFGDGPEMADELAALIMKGVKNATCCSLASFQQDNQKPSVGDYHIILNGAGNPVCVIRTTSMRLIRFSEMTETLAAKEGEGDLSLHYWQQEHRAFFEREGTYAEDMELIFEEFQLTEIV